MLLDRSLKQGVDLPANPHNPSIGGSAKGIVVREIDALGGYMGKCADQEYLQMKMLNTKKGAGVQCLRAQADKKRYPHNMQEHLLNTPNLDILEGEVIDLIHTESKVQGVILKDEKKIYSQAVILATGTYMNSDILRGHHKESGGPDGEQPSIGLSDNLRKMGLCLQRLKTGTPQRIAKESIDFSKAEIQFGNVDDQGFSYESSEFIPLEEQKPCFLIYTTPKTHEIIREHLKDSAMYGGLVEGVGPRYCPSIEDKIVRFADKPRHQLFLEPESYDTNSIYLQGFSTSMPEDVQDEMVHSLPGLENAKILKYAYAIEYDALDPLEFDNSLMTKKYEGLFISGQICGTSGYEEAAGLGLMAGVNASLYIDNKPPFILGRDEAYIGVMIDDLITKGTKEPYRLLSSRAEYRLLLRHDNADFRLLPKAHELGLVSDERYNKFSEKKNAMSIVFNILEKTYFGEKSPINEYLSSLGYEKLTYGVSAKEILKRNGVTFKELKKYLDIPVNIKLDNIAEEQVEIYIKYEGYILNQRKEAEKLHKLDNIEIKADIDYLNLDGLALEARQKFDAIKPKTIGQASRISGVNPSDINVLIMYLRKNRLI